MTVTADARRHEAATTRRVLLRRIATGLLALCLWAAATAAAAPLPHPLQGLVTWVYDADTVEVAPHGTVRLLGIDAPERSASPRDYTFVQLGAAGERLRSIHAAGVAFGIRTVKGETVTLHCESPQRDRFGRLLAYLVLPDGRLYNRLLIEEGLAITYRRFDFLRKADFLAAEAQARQHGVGLWAPADRVK